MTNPAVPAEKSQELAVAGLRAFFSIAEAWQLRDEEARILLGLPSRATFYKWKRGDVGTAGNDLLERISYILGIYKALQILFPDAGQADAWPRAPNDAWGGQSALDRMLAGHVADLYVVRKYLDHVRGGGS